MRILQVTPFYPPHVGGIEFHVEALSRRLVEAGHEVVVYTSRVPETTRSETVQGVQVCRFAAPFLPLNNPFMPGLLPMLLRSNRFDVVHAHGHFHASSTLAVFANMFRRCPMVLTCHGAILEYRGWKRAIEMFFNKTVGWWTLRSADRVVALTPTQAGILRRLGAPHHRTAVIPGWVELPTGAQRADAAAFRAAHSLGDRKVVLFVGRLLPVKGLNYLIDAAAMSKAKPIVAVIGDEAPGYAGTRESLLEQVDQLGLKDRVLFLGRFAREELEAAYEAADLFVLPSLGEGLPLALLEAMSHGRCVLATDVPGNTDVVDDGANGALVEARNGVALARKIDELLADDRLRARLGEQARRDIEQSYTPGAVLSKILDVYREARERRLPRRD